MPRFGARFTTSFAPYSPGTALRADPLDEIEPPRGPAGMALFDVGETLITFNSMFRFLAWDFRARGLPPSAYHRAARPLHQRSAAGVSRQRTNRAYYRLFAGRPVDEVYAQGRRWFAAELESGALLHAPTVDALRHHQREGAVVALVSGSFGPCVQPLAELLGAEEVLCGDPEVVGGYYTGHLEHPVIGTEKGRLAAAALRRRGVPACRAVAYADHSSDLPLLRTVGRGVVVGDDFVLGTHVARTGGGTLPGVRHGTH